MTYSVILLAAILCAGCATRAPVQAWDKGNLA